LNAPRLNAPVYDLPLWLCRGYSESARDQSRNNWHASSCRSKDIQQGVVYNQNGVQVIAIQVKHANLPEAFGFRVEYKERAVAISGDMARHEDFVQYAQGADVVLHEVGIARPELLEKASEIRKLLATHHSTPEDAAGDFTRISQD
jgi:ribonuclease Z